MKKLFQRALFICVLTVLTSCIDKDFTHNKLLGSWEGSTGHDNTWCATYKDDGHFDLFSRRPIPNFTATSLVTMGKKNTEEASAEKNSTPSLGVGYSAGYWNVARGGRFWQRGAVVRDNTGREIPANNRVVQKGDWYVIRFNNNQELSLQSITIESDNAVLTRVANCNHFEKDVNMVFNDPVWPEDNTAKGLQELEKD